MNTKGILSAILASTFFLGACTGTVGAINGDDDATLDTTTSALGASISGDALVGQGYDSVTRTAKVNACLEPRDGKWVETGGSSSTVDMSLQSDRTKLAESLGIDVEVKGSFASAAASFYRATASDDLSIAYTYGSATSFKDLSMTTGYRVASDYASITSPVAWYQKCGDSVVSKVSRGTSLFTAFKLRFSSSDDKKTFESKFNVKSFVSASAALKAAQSVAKTNVSVEVSAVQVGGVPTELGKVLEGASASTCSMADPNACVGYLTSVERYATKEYPAQFRDASGKPLTGKDLDDRVMTNGYQTRSWAEVVIPNLPDLGDLTRKQDGLLMMYEEQFAAIARLQAIQELGTMPNRSETMRQTQLASILETRDVVMQNQDELRSAWRACYPDEKAECTAKFNAAKAALQKIPADRLQPWFDAKFPAGNLAKPVDFVDLRGDGHKDFCWADQFSTPSSGTHFVCNMGRGQGVLSGSEDVASYRVQLPNSSMDGVWTPPVWIPIGNAKGYCKPSGGGGSLYCVTMEGTKMTGMLAMTKVNGNWQKRFDGASEPKGYTVNAVLDSASKELKASYGYDFKP